MRQSKNKSLARKKSDKYFSKYIRKKYAKFNGSIQCITCGNWKHWKKMHCGHWRRRGLEPTRYDERNVAPQCVKCNHFRSGEPERFEEAIRIKYGKEVLDEIR